MHSTQVPLHVVRAEFGESRAFSVRRHNIQILEREARRSAWRRRQEMVCRAAITVGVVLIVMGVLDFLKVVTS